MPLAPCRPLRPRQGQSYAWVAAIARSRAIDRRRAETARAFVMLAAELPDFLPRPEDARPAIEAVALRRRLIELRPEYRRALLLAYVRGYTNAELAEVLGVPVGTAKSWLRRGLIALKQAHA
ncbi:MAG TPA: RNA polymerase sigma factor [Paracoccaceae bacterium]|nr:RNA polymerase sigma factor [Paracoccaceae bacterium]